MSRRVRDVDGTIGRASDFVLKALEVCDLASDVLLLSLAVRRNEQTIMRNLSSCFWHKAVFMTCTFHLVTVRTVPFSISDPRPLSRSFVLLLRLFAFLSPSAPPKLARLGSYMQPLSDQVLHDANSIDLREYYSITVV